MSEEERRRREGRRGEQSLVNKAIDKAQEARRGRSGGRSDAIDKAIDKAQESGLVDKLADRFFKGRRGRR